MSNRQPSAIVVKDAAVKEGMIVILTPENFRTEWTWSMTRSVEYNQSSEFHAHLRDIKAAICPIIRVTSINRIGRYEVQILSSIGILCIAVSESLICREG